MDHVPLNVMRTEVSSPFSEEYPRLVSSEPRLSLCRLRSQRQAQRQRDWACRRIQLPRPLRCPVWHMVMVEKAWAVSLYVSAQGPWATSPWRILQHPSPNTRVRKHTSIHTFKDWMDHRKWHSPYCAGVERGHSHNSLLPLPLGLLILCHSSCSKALNSQHRTLRPAEARQGTWSTTKCDSDS